MRPPKFHRMFGYNLGLLPNAHLSSLEEGVTTIEEAKRRSGLTIGYPGWGVIYHILLSHLDRNRREVIVETGTNWGCTTIVLAQALKDAGCDGRVMTFELNPANAERAAENFRAAGLDDRIDLHVGDSRILLKNAIENESGIRVVFLDASHLYSDVKAEFEMVLPKLAEDAIVIMDNTYRIAEENEDPLVNGFLRELTGCYGGNLINLEYVSWYTPGLAIWQKKPAL